MELEEILAELVRWERFFDSGGTAREDLLALDSPDVRIGLSNAGILSSRFICQFKIGRLDVDCTCIATGEEDDDREDVSRWPDALATVRLAILLVNAEREGLDWLPNDPQATLRVESDDTGVSFRVRDAWGEICADEESWDGLLRLLSRPPEDGASRIWV